MAGKDFGFNIPANYLTDATTFPGYPAHPEQQILPDRNFSVNNQSRLFSQKTNAVTQRSTRGINPGQKTFNVQFSNRPEAEAEYILAFFKVNKGVSPFRFVIPYTFSYTAFGGNVAAANTSLIELSDRGLGNVYEDALVTSTFGPALQPNTTVSQVNSTVSFSILPTQVIPDGTNLTFTNVKRELFVVCTKWNAIVNYIDSYSINAEFSQVYQGDRAFTVEQGNIT